jgi:REP element-mobilizing transposase RayT
MVGGSTATAMNRRGRVPPLPEISNVDNGGRVENIFRPNRESIRLPTHDYRSAGAYYATLCAQDRLELFGDVIDGQMRLSCVGKIIQHAWENIPLYGPGIGLDEFNVMPDHLHGIILIGLHGLDLNCGQAQRPAPTMTWDIDRVGAGFHPRPQSQNIKKRISMSDIIQRFKSWTTFQFHKNIKRHGAEPLQRHLWQRNYYEHIVRNDRDLNRIRDYIQNNPKNWESDPEKPTVGAAPCGRPR